MNKLKLSALLLSGALSLNAQTTKDPELCIVVRNDAAWYFYHNPHSYKNTYNFFEYHKISVEANKSLKLVLYTEEQGCEMKIVKILEGKSDTTVVSCYYEEINIKIDHEIEPEDIIE